MREPVGGATQIVRAQHRCVCNRTQRQDNAGFPTLRQLLAQVGIANLDFERQRLVFRRQTFDRIGDAGIGEAQTVVHRGRGRSTRQPEFEERSVEQDARMVPGERARYRFAPCCPERDPRSAAVLADRQTAARACKNTRAAGAGRHRERPRGADNAGNWGQRCCSFETGRRIPKNGLRGSPRSPPSIAPGLWINQAQPNLRRHHGIDQPAPLRRRRYRWTASATKIPCIRPNITCGPCSF